MDGLSLAALDGGVASASIGAADEGALMAADEGALIAAARADPAAFAPLYQRYVGRVYRYLRVRSANAEDAADLTQQVFLQALGALSGYQPRGVPFAAWLFRIARHAAVDAHRRQRGTVPWDALPEARHPLAGSDPDADLIQRERLTRLRDLLATLDPEKRELLALRFAGHLSSTEIATVVGKRPDAVKKQLARILQSLKEQYHHGA